MARIEFPVWLAILVAMAPIICGAEDAPTPCDPRALAQRITAAEQRARPAIAGPGRPEMDAEEPPLAVPSVDVLAQRLTNGVQIECTILYLEFLGSRGHAAAPAVFRYLASAPPEQHARMAQLVGRYGIASVGDFYHASGDRMALDVADALNAVRDGDAFDQLARGLVMGAPLPKAFSRAALEYLVLNELDRRLDAHTRPSPRTTTGIAVQPSHPVFAHCLEEAGCEDRRLAAFALGLAKGAESPVVPALQRAIGDAKAEVRFAAAIALAGLTGIADASVHSIVVDALRNGDADSRRFAAAILAKADPALPQLEQALHDSDPPTRWIASRAFVGQTNRAAALPVFREMLGQPDYTYDGAEGLYRGTPASVPFLADALQDRDSKVRARAAWAVSRIRDRGSAKALLPRLLTMIGDGDEDVRRDVLKAIVAVAGPDTPEIVNVFLPLLASKDNLYEASLALAKVGRADARVAPALVAQAHSSDAAAARAGAEALAVLAPLSDDELNAITAMLVAHGPKPEASIHGRDFEWLEPIEPQLRDQWSKQVATDDAVLRLLMASADDGGLSAFVVMFKDPARRERGAALIREWVKAFAESKTDAEVVRRRALTDALTDLLLNGDAASQAAAARLLAVTHQIQHEEQVFCREEYDPDDDIEPTLTLLSWQPRVQSILERLMSDAPEQRDRSAAAVLLRTMYISNNAVNGALALALDDPDPFIRLFAASVVLRTKPGNAVALNIILQAQTSGRLYEVCLEQAVEALPAEAKRLTLAAWQELLRASHDDRFRLVAATQLIAVDSTSTLARNVLVDFAKRAEDPDRTSAIRALVHTGTAGAESIPWLIGQLSGGTSPAEQQEAVAALRRIGDAAYDPLLLAARNGNENAASALGEVFAQSALPRIVSLLDDERTRAIAIRALEAAGKSAVAAAGKLRAIMTGNGSHANAAAWALAAVSADARDALPYQCRSNSGRELGDLDVGKSLARFGVAGVADLVAAMQSSLLAEASAVRCVHDALTFGEDADVQALKRASTEATTAEPIRRLIRLAIQ